MATLVGTIVSIAFLAAFTLFFLKSRKGIALRAVADNQQVAMAMGINVERYFGIAWAMAGIVSALGGIIWGSMLGALHATFYRTMPGSRASTPAATCRRRPLPATHGSPSLASNRKQSRVFA